MDFLPVLSVLVLLASILIIGNAAVAVLRLPYSYALPLGIGLIGIVVTAVMVTADRRLTDARYAVALMTLVSLYFVRGFVANRKAVFTTVALVGATFIVIILPAVLGHAQFYAFRGNWWDHFNYIAGVESIADYRASALRHLSDGIASADPTTIYAVAPVSLRPAVGLVAAVFKLDGADIFAYSYAYLALLLAALTPVIALALATLRNGSLPQKLYYLLAASIPVGFWGQMLLDSAVWSHIACMPLLAMLFYSMMVTTSESNPRQRPPGMTLATLLLFLGAFVIYPEATSVLTALLILTRVITMRSINWGLYYTAVFAAAALIAGAIDFSGSVGFFLAQAKFGVAQTQGNASWFLYTFQPYFGFDFTELFRGQIDQLKALTRDAGPVALLRTVVDGRPSTLLLPLNFIPILLGYYPLINAAATASIVLSASVSLVFLGAVACLAVRLWRDGRRDAQVRTLWCFVAAFCVLLLGFVARAKIWEAGKALSFVMPLLLPLFFVILLRISPSDQRLRQIAVGLSFLFIASSGYFAVARICLAQKPAGVGHSSPFPSVIRVEDKEGYRYLIPARLKACSSVVVTEAHRNRAVYLLLAARQAGPTMFDKPFSYYGFESTTYAAPPPPADACRVQFGGPESPNGLSTPQIVPGSTRGGTG